MFGKKEPKIITDENKIDEVLTRSISEILPSKEEFKKELMSGRRLKFYIGADATGPDLHLGHATNFFIMERLRELGHEIVILFGDFTAMIGDPTGKEAARVRLTKGEVESNIKTWKEQISHVLKIKDRDNPVIFKRNSEWLSGLTFEKIVDLASNFTVQQMIERDMFENRIKEGKPVYLHEFFYPLMVGYDSLVLDVDAEIGGTDQTFNMLAGRTLQKSLAGKNKFVISTTLLENPATGKKLMSKSEGGYISLQDSPNDMYGKVMALHDLTINQLFIDATWLPLSEVEELKSQVESDPKKTKMRLAREIVSIYHTEEAAQKAEENWEKTFSKGEAPDDIEEIKVTRGTKLSEVAIQNDLVSSGGEWKRMVTQNAVSFNDEKIGDINFLAESDGVLKIGKRRFVKVVVG